MGCEVAKAFDGALAQCSVQGPRANLITVQTDPRLDGFRSDGFATMSMQTAMLGVPSIQLELPAILREQLLLNTNLCDCLADGICNVFSETVSRWSPARTTH